MDKCGYDTRGDSYRFGSREFLWDIRSTEYFPSISTTFPEIPWLVLNKPCVFYIYIYFLLFSIGSLSFGYDTRVDSFRCGSHEFMRDARSTECKSMAKAVKTVPGLRKRLSYTRDYQPELQERQKRKRERKKSIITGYHGCCMASSVFFDLQ